ncbi:Effector of nucleoid occlusion Noc [Halobacillus karajensis]|uniref:Nucleoid occlusion protein n=1 Tax=Halobacillus karajensis TaxID=195088 RepID=A0A059NVT2_9BACI|nr:nucleoid occlusion protein [Halobacillus karajensis]CDQ18409.1 Nucleoid occlusion protein [Halobacillus karajensis]CDQ23519.1 Nucleoid occlusion protein [Halobacillus karajensis]CDQ27001.1 Nucleoid occlusion protein [Halobacillus karajensis]SEH51779.1 Effector of nucleoid occlusion Noc [Halobacillus karajensis]
MLHPFGRLFGLGDKPDSDNDNNEEEGYNPDEVVQVPVERVQPNRYQPRAIFNNEKISELAQTIHTHGMIQPIVLRRLNEEEYELIAGERRWRAVQSLGWETIPAIIRDMDDSQTASVALIENLQREELTVIEEAVAYGKLLELHQITQEALAQRLGKSQSTIANKLRLLKLPESVQQAVMDKKITERHARALIALKETEQQEKVLTEIIEKQWNVKQTEERIAKLNDPQPKKKKPTLKGVNKDMRIAMNTIRQSLTMVTDTGIDLETDEEDHDDYYQITIKIPKGKKKS